MKSRRDGARRPRAVDVLVAMKYHVTVTPGMNPADMMNTYTLYTSYKQLLTYSSDFGAARLDPCEIRTVVPYIHVKRTLGRATRARCGLRQSVPNNKSLSQKAGHLNKSETFVSLALLGGILAAAAATSLVDGIITAARRDGHYKTTTRPLAVVAPMRFGDSTNFPNLDSNE
ncbi:hypothetical protein EVAR_60697_1 [Eumeta japonica]|uniref:Uncharacterized protein n=1 Tax=Eumeta variegata TaxID=151549 RepID=A0A4C1ZLL7_EUMVA|nr:hypothetical protein EVAR_60697_1 [Eumeta japonica]